MCSMSCCISMILCCGAFHACAGRAMICGVCVCVRARARAPGKAHLAKSFACPTTKRLPVHFVTLYEDWPAESMNASAAANWPDFLYLSTSASISLVYTSSPPHRSWASSCCLPRRLGAIPDSSAGKGAALRGRPGSAPVYLRSVPSLGFCFRVNPEPLLPRFGILAGCAVRQHRTSFRSTGMATW